MDRERFARVVAVIKEHPENWDQSIWHCGTSHCFAGHAQLLSVGHLPDAYISDASTLQVSVREDAAAWLDLSKGDADYFFHPVRRLEDFEAALQVDDKGFDAYGYDADGFDKDGIDRLGFNREGVRGEYNREGCWVGSRMLRDCVECEGTGYLFDACPLCERVGRVPDPPEGMMTCPECDGESTEVCPLCEGSGVEECDGDDISEENGYGD